MLKRQLIGFGVDALILLGSIMVGYYAKILTSL
ncbi:UNVERIFIED_ORG: hypothetical protein BDK47_11635 [Anoxybacillus amylolyticus]